MNFDWRQAVFGAVLGGATAFALHGAVAPGFALVDPSPTPSPLSVTPGEYVVPYRGYLEIDGVPFTGDVSVSATLRAGGSTYSETFTTVFVSSGQFQLALGTGSGGGLPEWVFTSEVVELTLGIDGTTLPGRQRLYPAVSAVRRVDMENVVLSGTTTVESGVTVDGPSVGWPHSRQELTLDLALGGAVPTGVGLTDDGTMVFDAFEHMLFAGTSAPGSAEGEPTMHLTDAGLQFNGDLSTEGVSAYALVLGDGDVLFPDDATLRVGFEGQHRIEITPDGDMTIRAGTAARFFGTIYEADEAVAVRDVTVEQGWDSIWSTDLSARVVEEGGGDETGRSTCTGDQFLAGVVVSDGDWHMVCTR